MPRCLKCNYELVLLERRHKFKCAKCSNLFTEEEIKLTEFKKYNKTERAKEKTEAKKQERKELNKKLRDPNPNYDSIYYQKKKKANQKSKEYYYKHREELLKKKAEEYQNGKQDKMRTIRKVIMKCMQILPTFVLA